MDLNRMRYFLAVASAGSFSRAARKVHVSQPTLSKMVKQFEDELGVRLLERGKEGVRLTREGQTALERCEAVLDEVAKLKSDISAGAGDDGGELRIGASDNICNYVLPGALQALGRRYKNLEVEIFSGTANDILRELRDHKIELGFFYSKPASARDLELTALRTVEFVIVAAKPAKLRELAEAPYVGSRRADYRGLYPAYSMLEAAGLKPKTVIQANNQETQKKLCLAGIGFTVVPKHMVDQELAHGSLFRVPIPKPLHSEVWCAKRLKGELGAPAAGITDLLREDLFWMGR